MKHAPEIDNQILIALERISEAFKVLLWGQSKESGLSPIQIQLLIFIGGHDTAKCKVTYLATEFNITKATVSDSVKVMLQKGYLQKVADLSDTRSFSLALTPSGRELMIRVSGFNNVLRELMIQFSDSEKSNFYSTLHRLIRGLNANGIISVQRNCASCAFYNNSNGQHYCGLVKANLVSHEIKTDCADHIAR